MSTKMDLKSVQTLTTGSPEESLKILTDFNTHHEKSKDFPEIDSNTKLQLWNVIFTLLEKSSTTTTTTTPHSSDATIIIQACLNTLRILSREKKTLESAITDEKILILLNLSGLKVTSSGEPTPPFKSVEALKVIFNMVFQSSTLQIMFISNGILYGITQRIQDFTLKEEEYPPEYQYFVLRILFLITALCQDTAPAKVRNLHNGLVVINNFLESITQAKGGTNPPTFDDLTSDIICETLKVFYNLIHNITPSRNPQDIDQDDLDQLKRLTNFTRSFLLFKEDPETNKKHLEIKHHSIDLLSAVPPPCFPELIPPVSDAPRGAPEVKYQYEGLDMTAVESVVDFLDSKLDQVRKGITQENLAPPLGALHNMVSSNRAIRKYLKVRILPPLSREDVIDLPEVGRTIRNKLCALLTSPVTHITELVANLLFIMCKESVKKLIKYTGYGNAAGLLANKGLMLGGKAPPGKYSDSEEESDTEDYKEVEHLINQVEGRIQLERPDPMEGMTEEQKEVEAMKLINVIDKMERDSAIIKPCRIGPDGRPVPIQHVLQLQEALENPMKSLRRNEDSDSDSD